MIYDKEKPFDGAILNVSCPPTPAELRTHYELCLERCEVEANRKVFRDLLAELEIPRQ